MAWMKYWLTAVSSAVRTSLRISMTWAFPCILTSGVGVNLNAPPGRGEGRAAAQGGGRGGRGGRGQVPAQVGQAGLAVPPAAAAAHGLLDGQALGLHAARRL